MALICNTNVGDCKGLQRERIMYAETMSGNSDEKVSLLYKAWSDLLAGNKRSNVPQPPHLENCKSSVEVSRRLDTRLQNGTFPPWTTWKGMLDRISSDDEQLKYYRDQIISQGTYPPWVCM